MQAIAVRDNFQKRRVQLSTTEFVLIEVADAFSAPPLRAMTVEICKGLRQADMPSAIEVVPLSEELLVKDWDLYSPRPDKEWGLADCISFGVMQDQGLIEAFTSKHHFAQAGFAILLSHRP